MGARTEEAAARSERARAIGLFRYGLIREAAANAVRTAAAGKYAPLLIDPPLVYEVQLLNSGFADNAARADGAERIDPTTLRVAADDPATAFKRMRALIALA